MDQIVMITKVIDETGRIVDGIEPDQLDDPTPCDGWTIRDVLNHITGGADVFAIAATEGSVPDEKLGELMGGGDNLGDDYKASFKAASTRALDAFRPAGTLDKVIMLPFGEMPASAALNIAIFDVTTHAWDLAKATGQSTALDPDVLAAAYEIAQQMLGDEFRASGAFGPEVAVPDDAPLEDRLAGLTGRTP